MNTTRNLVGSILTLAGAQGLTVLMLIMRMKLMAVMLGPVGIAVMGVYNNFQFLAAALSGLGISTSGVRQIARAADEQVTDGATEQARQRRVLLVAFALQGGLACVLIYGFRDQLAIWLLGDALYETQIALTGAVVLVTLLTAAATTVLQGLRRVREIARMSVISTMSGTIVGLGAISAFGLKGLIWFLIAHNSAYLAMAWYYLLRLPRTPSVRMRPVEIWVAWRPMASEGIALMAGSLAGPAALLAVRALVGRELGLAEAGIFSAAWSVTTLYVGFFMQAMATDYYPRLSAVFDRHEEAQVLVNDQLQILMALGGPLLIAMIALAPWLIQAIYSPTFLPAAEILQWQSWGNVFKLAAFPLGFTLMAAGRARLYLSTELAWNAIFIALVSLLMPYLGLRITGIAFLLGYSFYWLMLMGLTRRLLGLRLEPLSLRLILWQLALAGALVLLAQASQIWAAMLGLPSALLAAVAGLRIVLGKIGPEGRVPAQLNRLFARMRWPVVAVKASPVQEARR